MKQYSFIVQASSEVVVADLGLTLEAGRNVFTAIVQDLEALLVSLERDRVRIIEMHLMEAPTTTVSDLLLQGESLAVLNPHAWRSRT